MKFAICVLWWYCRLAKGLPSAVLAELLWGNTGEKNTYVFIHTFVAPALFPATVATMYGYETGLSLTSPALNFF